MSEKVKIKDRVLKCVVCGSDTFDKVDVKLNSTGAVLWNAELFARGGEAYICDSCGFAHQFFIQNIK